MSSMTPDSKENLISVGIDSQPVVRDVNVIRSELRKLQADLRKLEKSGDTTSTSHAALKSNIEALKRERTQAQETAKAYKSLNQETKNATQAAISYSAAVGAGRVSAKQRLDMTLADVKALAEKAAANKLIAQQEEAMFRNIQSHNKAQMGSTAALSELRKRTLNELLTDERRALAVIQSKNTAIQQGISYLGQYRATNNRETISQEEALFRAIQNKNKAIQEGLTLLERQRRAEEAVKLKTDKTAAAALYSESYFNSRRDGLKALESQILATQQVVRRFGEEYSRVLLGPGKAGAITAAATSQAQFRQVTDQATQALGRQMAMAQQMDRSITFRRQKEDAATLFAQVRQNAEGFTDYGRRVAAASAVVQKFGEERARALLSPANRALLADVGNLERYRRGVDGVRQATHAAALAHDALHSAARGVSGVLGGLWLTYARMLPVLLGVAAATKLVKDSISGGLDVGFATQFAAILQTENMLGKGQSDAYTNLAALRDDIRKSLIDISRESVFTVEQNAQALQKLSLAGVNAQKGLELLTTASNVAVLSQVDLGQATTMVLDTLYNFGMASESSITMAENYAKASDIMAFTANTVNASFEDIARSFENITGVAGTFNVTIEEASALLQSLAKTGIRGPKAGTYVRNFMDDLLGAPISQRAEKQLDSLNIERYNADLYGEGDFGAAKYIDELVESLSKLGFVEQQNAIRAITNQRSRRVLRQELIEYKNGLKEVNGALEQTNSLYDRTVKLQADAQGSLARMAEGLTGDTKYQFIMAQSAYNAAVNEAYLPAEPALRGAAQSLQALFRSDEFREAVTTLVTGFASLAKGAAEFTLKAVELTKYLDGLGGVLATVAKYAAAAGGAFLALKGYAAVSATIAGLGGAAAAASAGVKLLNTALLANPAVAVGTALVATLVYLDQWYEKSKKYEQSLAGRQAKLDELRKAEAEYAAQVERKQSGDRDWLDSLFPEEKLAETRAQIKSTVDSIAADMNSAMDSVSFQNSFDKILNETDTFLTSMRNAARQAGGDFETEYRNKLVRSIEDASETLQAYSDTVANLDQSTAAGKQFAAFMTAWLSGISERAMIAGEELGRLNLVLSNQSLKAAADGLEFGVKDLSKLESANEELMKSIRALELGEDGLFRYQQEQKKTQLASLESAYAALEFAYSMAAAANAPLAALEQMQAQMVATAINMSRLTDNIALSQRERELTPAKRGPRPDRDPIRAQLEEARTAIQDFKNSYAEMLGSIQDSTKDLAIGPLEAYERSMRAAAEAYDQMFAAISKAKNTAGLSANDRQKLQTDENKLIGEANKETRRLVDEYHEILEGRSKNLEDLEIATGRKVLGAAESWLREYASKYGETVTLLQSDIANLETKLKVAVETGQSDEEVARLAAALKVLKDQLVSFGKSATLGAWAADIEESIGIAEKTLESFSQTLDRMADKSNKEGLFGTLSGNAAAFEATKAQYVRSLQESINEIKKKIREAEQRDDFKVKPELEIELKNLEGKLQEASERIDPVLEGWGDSLGDYIANGIVYGFDEGESPAKAFANFLKREIYVALAQALSQQFKLNLVSVFGGGSGGASSGGGSSGGIGMPGIPGMDMMGMAANGLSWLGGATGLTGVSSFAAGMGMTSYTSAAAMTGLAEAGLVSGVTSGAAASAGSMLGAVGTAMPYITAALFAAQALGLFDKKPSDKSSWASYDPNTGKTFDVGSMTGKKDPGQEQRDATAALAMLTGGFAGLAGIDASVTAMIGGRDGTRLRINRDEGTQGFLTPQAGVANGNNSLNYGNGEEAIKKMLDDLVDEGTLPQATIDAWRAAKTDMLGTARDAVELVSVLNLLTADYDTATIERANLLQMEGEMLEQAVGRMEQIEAVLGGNMLPGDAMASAAADMVKTLDGLALGSIPTTNEALGQIINSLDTTSEEGQKTYKTLMALAPGFIELQAAQEQMYNGLLTDEQRLSKAAGEYAEAFKQLGVAMPENREGLLDLLGSFDRTTESGARLYAQILALSAGFLETEEAAKQLEDQRTESYRKLLSDEENLALDRKNLADEFAKLGYTLPKSKEELRGWIDALNNSADVAGTEKERLQKIAEAYDKTFGGSTGFEAFINSAGQTEEEARKTANGLIALIEATLDYQEALDKSTEAARNAREEATRAYTATALDRRTEAIESLRSPDELAARDARQLAESSRGLTSSFEKLGFALPNSIEELRGFFEQLGGLPNWASTGPTVENALLDLVAPFIDYLELKEKVLGVDEATSSDDAIERARDNLRAAYEDQRASLEKTQDAMRSFVDSLKQYRTSLLMGDKSPLNPLEKYRLAQAEFETTSALAATGDEDALGKLQSVSDAFLDASRQMYASGAAYSLDFDKVLSALDAAGVAAGIEETLAQQSLEQLEIQVGALIDINESVLSVEQAIKELAEAFASGSTSGAYTQIADTYRTSLGRDPDSAGMAYWMTQHDKGTSVADIQTSIAGSAEAQLRSAYKEVLGRDPDSAGAAYWLTELQKGLSMDQLEQSLAYGAAPQDKAKALEWLQGNGLPGFANGGLHSGGLRVVGERGVEIEATGPARYWNFNQTQQMLGGSPELLAEVRALRAEVAALRQQQAAEHREAVAANYDASDRNAARISESTERVDRQRRTAERFA